MRNNLVSSSEIIKAAVSSRLFVFVANLQSFGKLNLMEILISEIISFILVVLVYFLFRKREFTNIKFIRVLVSIYLAVVLASTAFTLSYYTTNNLSYNYNYLVIPILVVLVSLYLANNGIEGVCRFSNLAVGFIFVLMVIFIIITKGDFSISNFNDNSISINNTLYYTVINFEVIMIFIFKDNTKSFSKNSILSFNNASFFIPVISYISFVGILGFGIISKYDFPLEFLVNLVSANTNNNLSYLFTATIIILAINRMSFIFSSIFKLQEIKKADYIIPTAIITLSVILFRSILVNSLFNMIIYFAVPSILILITVSFSKKGSKR